MTDEEWREVCVDQCWLDIDLHILEAMKQAYDLGYSHGWIDFQMEKAKHDYEKKARTGPR